MARLLPRFVIAVALAAATVTAFGGTAAAAPGDLDASFGGGGRVTFTPGGKPGRVFDVAIQPDGKILLVGDALKGGVDYDFAITRLNANGSPDTGFGSGGTVLVDNTTTAGATDSANAVAIQSDGKIVVAGSTSVGGGRGMVVRLDANGVPDNSFGAAVTTDGPGVATIDPNLAFNDVAIAPDGKILLAGTWDTETTFTPAHSTDAFAARLKADGSVDPSFSGGGTFITDVDYGGDDGAVRMAVQPDGKIVLAGWASQSDVAVARVTPEAGIDTSFGVAGKRVYGFGAGANDQGTDVALQPDGHILVGGFGSVANNMLVTRLTSAGTPENSLNGNNTVDADFGGQDIANALALQSNGKILLGGADDHEFALVRFQPGGLPDETFGPGGKRTVTFPGSDSEADAMALQPDGKIVIAGTAGSNSAVARLEGDATATGGGPGGGGGGGGPGGGGGSKVPKCAGKAATIVGTSHGDRLTGTRRSDVIVALGGNDSVNGGGGNDIICAGAGNDKVSGGSGSDRIYGEAGKDKLSGGAGNDKLSRREIAAPATTASPGARARTA